MRKHAKITIIDLASAAVWEGSESNEFLASIQLGMKAGDDKAFDQFAIVIESLEALLENSAPIPERGLSGDLNPCEICGKFGSHNIGSGWGIQVCKMHYDWYTAEVNRIKEEKADGETVPDET